jgi:hypothetical protein
METNDKNEVRDTNEVKNTSSHVWDNYQLSSEVKSMAPEQRKDIYGDYDDLIASIMEEEHVSAETFLDEYFA